MFAWYKRGTPLERKTFWACFSGWALDALDVQMFTLAIPAIIATYAIDKTQAGAISGITPRFLGTRRLDRRSNVGPHRTHSHVAVDHRLVLRLHVPVRVRADLSTTARAEVTAGIRLRRRMGGRCGPHGGNHPYRESRQGDGCRAKRVGSGLGRSRVALYRDLLAAPSRNRVARDVRHRVAARLSRPLCPALTQGAAASRTVDVAEGGLVPTHESVRAARAEDNPARCVAWNRRTRRLLRHHDLVTDVPSKERHLWCSIPVDTSR